jgi:hypothetical protein
VHKTANILDKMPKSVQDKAKQLIHEMYLAPTRKAALAAYDQFISSYQSRLNSNKGTKCDIGFYLSKAIPSWVLVGKCVPPTERRLEMMPVLGLTELHLPASHLSERRMSTRRPWRENGIGRGRIAEDRW